MRVKGKGRKKELMAWGGREYNHVGKKWGLSNPVGWLSSFLGFGEGPNFWQGRVLGRKGGI